MKIPQKRKTEQLYQISVEIVGLRFTFAVHRRFYPNPKNPLEHFYFTLVYDLYAGRSKHLLTSVSYVKHGLAVQDMADVLLALENFLAPNSAHSAFAREAMLESEQKHMTYVYTKSTINTAYLSGIESRETVLGAIMSPVPILYDTVGFNSRQSAAYTSRVAADRLTSRHRGAVRAWEPFYITLGAENVKIAYGRV